MAFLGDFYRVLSFAAEHSGHPLVKDAYARSGVSGFSGYESFRKIKPLSKYELSEMHERGLLREILACGGVSKIFTSPGSIYNVKGERFEHYRFYKALAAAGFGRGDAAVNTFSYHVSPAGDMFEEACEKLGCAVYPLGPADSSKGAEAIAASGANSFIGTGTYLKKCLEKLGHHHGITKAFLAAEKLSEESRAEFKDLYGISVSQAYGTAELGLVGYETADSRHFTPDTEAHFIEILEHGSAEPLAEGEVGEVVVTFMNSLTPFMRLATGDLSAIKNGRLTGVLGRADSSVKVKGVFLHWWVFEKFMADNKIKGILTIEKRNGTDFFSLKISNGNTHEISEAFSSRFGLRLPEIKVDDNISTVSINDLR
jgi:phenylacetate-CoA ligase